MMNSNNSFDRPPSSSSSLSHYHSSPPTIGTFSSTTSSSDNSSGSGSTTNVNSSTNNANNNSLYNHFRQHYSMLSNTTTTSNNSNSSSSNHSSSSTFMHSSNHHYYHVNNNLPHETLSSILSDPKAFPSLSQLVPPSLSSSTNITKNSKNVNGQFGIYNEQSIHLQRCPNNHDYKSIHHGSDFINNQIIQQFFSPTDIETIFTTFRHSVKLQNKICKSIIFEQCFDGNEAFQLLQEILLSYNSKFLLLNTNNSSQMSISKLALHLGQYLLTIGKFHHVCREHCFKNVNLLYYQFESTNNQPTPLTSPSPCYGNGGGVNLQFNELKVTNSPNWHLLIPKMDSFIVQQSTASVQLFQCSVSMNEIHSENSEQQQIENSPIFIGISLVELKFILLSEILPMEEGVEMLYRNDDLNFYCFLQKTKFQEYPDYITVQLLCSGGNCKGNSGGGGGVKSSSTIAMYSRCKYGYSDWGSNKERVTNWIVKLMTKCQQKVN